MKKLLLAFFVLIGLCAKSQVPSGYTKQSIRLNHVAGKDDSGRHVPGYNGVPYRRVGVWDGSGNVGVDTTNHDFYFYSDSWLRVAKASDLALVDSVNSVAVKNMSSLRAINYWTFSSLKKSSTDKPLIETSGYTNPGDGGGARFYFDDTAMIADNSGTIIRPTAISSGNPGRWKMIIKESLYPEHFGAVGDGATNDVLAFRAILNYAKTDTRVQRILLNNKTYYLADSLEINAGIIIEGLSIYDGNKSTLFFPYPVKGINVKWPYTFYARNFNVSSNNSAGTDSTQYGIKLNSVCHLRDMTIQGFAGAGVLMIGDAGSTPFTNVDRSSITNVVSKLNGTYGFRGYGGDFNIVNFNNCEAVSNGAVGFYDQGFLGNSYYNNHAASNSSPELVWQKSLAKYSGVVYSALKNGLRGRPDLEPTGWYALPTALQYWIGFAPVATFDSARFYMIGGAYNFDEANVGGMNQFAGQYNNYAEQDQPLSYWNSKSVSFGGVPGNGTRYGVHVSALNNKLFVNQAIQASDNVRKDSIISELHARGVGVGINNSVPTQGAYLGWVEATKSIQWLSADGWFGTSAYGGTFWPTQASTTTTWGRPAAEAAAYYHPFNRSTYLYEADASGNYKRFTGGTTVPTTGARKQGDVHWNLAPTASSVLYWRCTADGTPGTWEAVSAGAGGSPAGNYGNVQLNRNGVFTTPASDSLDFDGGLKIKGLVHSDNSSTSLPGYAFSADANGPGSGLGYISGNTLLYSAGAASLVLTHSLLNFRVPSNYQYSWSSATDNLSSSDAGISRLAASKIAVGNGTAGTSAGTLIAGNIGIGQSSPTAYLHLAASTTTAGTGALKFTSGAPPTTPETGLMNMQNGLWFIDSSTAVRDTIATREWSRAIFPNSYINVVTGPATFYQLARQRNDSILDIKAFKLANNGAALTPTTTDTTIYYNLTGAALTKVDDTNVTLTLGGAPTTALLGATSLTLGWTGSLAVARGGTGQTSFTNGQLLIGNTTGNTLAKATLASADGSVTITNGAGTIDLSAIKQTEGTYVPTITGVANLAASSVPNFNWKRVGDQFEIWGEVTLDPTTTATLTQVGISLPISSSITNTYELSGTASDDLGTSVRVAGDGTNDRAEMRFTPTDVTNRVFSVHFKFKWIAP